MIIVAYDFEDNRKRDKFSKFLKRYGRKIQYSVYEIKNSHRILQNILSEIELKYKKDFSKADSILIFYLCESCQKKINRYGYAANEEEDIVIFQ
jgi:CRISPR-associated protein Cas2